MVGLEKRKEKKRRMGGREMGWSGEDSLAYAGLVH